MAVGDAVLGDWSVWHSEAMDFNVRFDYGEFGVRISREALEKLDGRSLPTRDDIKRAFGAHVETVLAAAARKASTWKDGDPGPMLLSEADF